MWKFLPQPPESGVHCQLLAARVHLLADQNLGNPYRLSLTQAPHSSVGDTVTLLCPNKHWSVGYSGRGNLFDAPISTAVCLSFLTPRTEVTFLFPTPGSLNGHMSSSPVALWKIYLALGSPRSRHWDRFQGQVVYLGDYLRKHWQGMGSLGLLSSDVQRRSPHVGRWGVFQPSLALGPLWRSLEIFGGAEDNCPSQGQASF